MFIGHFAVGFGLKRWIPQVSLGTLFLAAQFLDLLWPTLLLLGLETVAIRPGITTVTHLDFVSYPWSHSLLMALGWGFVVGGVAGWARRSTKTGVLLGLAVVSHWLLDALSHRPDLPLVPHGETLVGLELWRSLPATMVVEGALFVLGIGLYQATTIAKGRAGRWGFWGLVGLFVGIYLGNLFGPPPPDVSALAFVGHAQWLFVAWGYWLDRQRTAVAC